jgi:hypothetical protein
MFVSHDSNSISFCGLEEVEEQSSYSTAKYQGEHYRIFI